MKYLILTEGTAEKHLLDHLLDNQKLIFHRMDVLDEQVFRARQLRPSIVRSMNQLPYEEKVRILRVGDTQRDTLALPADAKWRIERIEKYCTKPEIEILIIIQLIQMKAFRSSRLGPKEFAKQYSQFQGTRYDESIQWWDHFLNNILVENVLLDYKRIKRHSKGELYLADLLI